MSLTHQLAVKGLRQQGFTVTEELFSATRMANGADVRIVMSDGTIKRGQHKGRTHKGGKR